MHDSPLLRNPPAGAGWYQRITRDEAGWEFLNFEARLLRRDETWAGDTGENEYAIVLLGGNFSVSSTHGTWRTEHGRKDVFSGIAHTLYLPRRTNFVLTAESDTLDIACGCLLYTSDAADE